VPAPSRPVHAADGLEILDNEAEQRYEAWLDGRPAGLIAYEPHDGCLVFDHTEVDEALEGRGIGSRLAKAALDDVQTRGLRVTPRCPFVRSYIRRHPEYRDLVVRATRQRG
jgi:predicted GNAT family acetyltransferase